MSSDRRLVLVTGSPRSGTTAVGRVLGSAAGAREIHEPLNALAGDAGITSYFEVPGSSALSTAEAHDLIERIRGMRLHLRSGLFPDDGLMKRSAKWVVGGRTRLTYLRAAIVRPSVLVWKDPFAMFWLPMAQSIGIDAIATYRPPLAVAGSFQRLGWRFDIGGLVERMQQAGIHVPPEIDLLLGSGAEAECAVNGAAVWLLCYGWLLEPDAPSVPLIDSGRFATDARLYSELYREVGLEQSRTFQKWQRRAIAKERTPTHAPDFGRTAHDPNRDLSRMNQYHETVLSPAQVDAIRPAVSTFAERLERRFWSPSP